MQLYTDGTVAEAPSGLGPLQTELLLGGICLLSFEQVEKDKADRTLFLHPMHDKELRCLALILRMYLECIVCVGPI